MPPRISHHKLRSWTRRSGQRQLHPCARSSARRAEEFPESTMYRDRCRERARFRSAARREREPVKVDTLHGAPPVRRMLLIGFLIPRCGAMHSALRLRGVRSAPAPGNADRRSIQVQHRCCSQLDAEFHEAACSSFAAFSSGCGERPLFQMWRASQRPQALCRTLSGPSAAAPPREARKRTRAAVRGGGHCEGRAASFCPKRRAQRHDEAVRFSGGVLRVAEDGGTKTQSITTHLASGRGCSFASNTASSTLLPLGAHATILLACYFAVSGVQRDVGRRPTPCADAVRRLRPRQRYAQRPQCVSPSSPCKTQNRCQLEWALIQFLTAIRHVCPFHKDAGT
ncbi:trans-sialidase [Trypanosoma cruzi]|nr:trans-sialidase [Trypanosoma cruzi]